VTQNENRRRLPPIPTRRTQSVGDGRAVITGEASAANTLILCFYRKDLIERSDEIHESLAWKALIRDPLEQLRPAQLRSYISASDVTNIFRALWVVHRVHGAHFDVHPQLTLYPALIIRRQDGLLLTVVDERQRFTVPHEASELPRHIGDVAESADALLQAVNAELERAVVPTGIEEFPGFQVSLEQSVIPDVRPTPPPTMTKLLKAWQSGANEFLLATGSHPHFLHLQSTLANCQFHDWTACHAIGQHQGNHAIGVRSVKPRSFFRSSEEHHCAHRQVHERRVVKSTRSRSSSAAAPAHFKHFAGLRPMLPVFPAVQRPEG
jgi:hypothetical protein